jgi:hypothetical protein
MATVALSTIRTRIATAIDDLEGWYESRNPLQEWGRAPNTVAHKNFSVGITACTQVQDDRQRRSPEGVMVRTTAAVRFAFRIRPKDQTASYGESLDAAQQIMRTITDRTTATHADLQIRFNRIILDMADSGEYTTHTVEFDILHYLSLTGA